MSPLLRSLLPARRDIVHPSRRHTLGSTAVPGRLYGLTSVEAGITRLAAGTGTMKFALHVHMRRDVRHPGRAIDAGMVRAAVAVLQRRHPLLRCVTRELDGGRLVLEERESLRMDVVVRAPGTPGADVWREESNAPIPIGACAAISRLTLAETSGTTHLIVSFNHAFADGVSGSIVTHELLSALMGDAGAEELEPLAWVHSSTTAIATHFRTETVAGAARLTGRQVRMGLRIQREGRRCLAFPRQDTAIDERDVARRCRGTFNHARLSAATTRRLVNACRTHGTTVGNICGAAAVEAASDLISDPRPRGSGSGPTVMLALAADLRRLYSKRLAAENLGFHVSACPSFEPPPRKGQEVDIWHVARRLKSHLAIETRAETALVLGSLLPLYYRTLEPDFRRMNTVTVSNWGNLPIVPNYGGWTIEDVVPYVNLNHHRMPTVAVSTANGQLALTVCVATPLVSERVAQAFLDRMMALLGAAATDGASVPA